MPSPRVTRSLRLELFLWVVFVILLLGAPACTDPSAVKRFASSSTAAGEKFPSIANDLTGSCVRRERYRLLGSWQDDLDSLDTATTGACKKYARAAPGLIGAHRVLSGYLDVLGKLSSGGAVDVEKPMGELGDAFAGMDPEDKRTIEAIKGVSDAVIEAAAGKWRRQQLVVMIEKTNSNFQTLASTLQRVVEEDYGRLLDGESEAARKYYLGMIREHRGSEPLTALLVYDRWQKEEDAIEARRDAARAYVKVLVKIAAGHQDLYEHRNDLKSKDVKKLILTHAAAIEDLAADIRRGM